MKILTTSILGLMALAISSQANVPPSQQVPNGASATDVHENTTAGAIRSSATSTDQVMQAQAALNSELTVGLTEDGIVGPATKAAIRQFQTEQGLSVTGRLDQATLQALGLADMTDVDRAPASVPNSQVPSPDISPENTTNF
ncbi:MAG: peptidoglycan-binding protein [Bdellovibrionaceae bacterium]|nr:peptidoglycan-binding protein [Pseudobdellovibrionaceae bacterium]